MQLGGRTSVLQASKERGTKDGALDPSNNMFVLLGDILSSGLCYVLLGGSRRDEIKEPVTQRQ